ncbi:hypothetical protein SLEP1_g46710 [Rubroshorea leprosula]|nr:hypothetical protein SLEP1_g46710 [Rubroshorea leprosula]
MFNGFSVFCRQKYKTMELTCCLLADISLHTHSHNLCKFECDNSDGNAQSFKIKSKQKISYYIPRTLDLFFAVPLCFGCHFLCSIVTYLSSCSAPPLPQLLLLWTMLPQRIWRFCNIKVASNVDFILKALAFLATIRTFVYSSSSTISRA